jgi:hypothetical protein
VVKAGLKRALGLALAIGGVAWLLHWLGLGLPLLLGLAVIVGFIAWALPWLGVRWLDEAIAFVRGQFWAREQGRFHAFGGVPLEIVDDGRHVWIASAGLQRVLGRREPEDVQAARHAGHWRRDEEGLLMLRVDAVVQQLASMPGRDAPRVQKLRRYLERDVLFPAERRRHTR